MAFKDKERLKIYQKGFQAVWKAKRRLKVIELLGGKCSKCEEADPEKLQFDCVSRSPENHVNLSTFWCLRWSTVLYVIHDLQLICANCLTVTNDDRTDIEKFREVFSGRKIIDIPTAAVAAGFSLRQFRRVIEDDGIQITWFGRKAFLVVEEFEKWLAEQPKRPETNAALEQIFDVALKRMIEALPGDPAENRTMAINFLCKHSHELKAEDVKVLRQTG